MKSRTFKVIILFLSFYSVCCCCFAGNKPIVLTFAHGGRQGHPYYYGAKKFAELVAEKTKGRIKIEIFPGGQLGSEGVAAEGVRLGTIDIATVSAGGIMSHWVPRIQVLDAPYLFENREQAYKALDGAVGEELNGEMEKAGFKNLAYWEIGIRHITNNRAPITSPSDLKGLSMRIMPARTYIAFVKTLGGIPQAIPFDEVYASLQSGIVDGEENPITTIRSMRYYEVQKYLALTAHVYSSAVLIINLEIFNNLPQDVRNAIAEAASESSLFQRKYVIENEAIDLEFLKLHGMEVVEPDKRAFARAVQNVYKEVMDRPSLVLLEQVKEMR
jgi:tripartite ATP-independent transporter DctP family solute receptor